MTPLELQARVEQLELDCRMGCGELYDLPERERPCTCGMQEVRGFISETLFHCAEVERELKEARQCLAIEEERGYRLCAERDALREHLRVAREALRDGVKALGDLSLECFAEPSPQPPSAGTYTRTFRELQRLRAVLAATEEKQPLPPGVVQSEGFDGQPEVLRETLAATEEKP